MKALHISTVVIMFIFLSGLDVRAQENNTEITLVNPEVVMKILRHRCDECHSLPHEEMEGAWGPSDDLNMMLRDKWVVPGDVSKSELLAVIHPTKGSMPPTSANNGNITQEEFDLIKTWIQQGALLNLPVTPKPDPVDNTEVESSTQISPETKTESTTTAPATQAAVMDAEDFELVDTTKDLSTTDRAFNLIGKFHSAVTHFPVALLLLAFVAEILLLCTRHPRYRSIVTFLLIFGTLGTMAAMFTGWKREDYGGFTNEYVEYHEWAAYTTFILALLALGLNFWRQKAYKAYEALEDPQDVSVNPAAIWSVRICLFLLAIAVGVTGFLGGAIRHGLDYYQW